MNPAELESALLQSQKDITDLQSTAKGLQKWVDALLEMQQKERDHGQKMQEKETLHRQRMDNREFLYKWKQRFQFQILKEMLFESADRLGRTKEQMEAEFDLRWKTRLDENLRKLEDTHPKLAAHVDERSEDELPPI